MDSAAAKELFQKASTFFAKGEYADALGCYEQLATVFPDQADVVHERVRCLIELGRFQEAHEFALHLGNTLGDLRANVLVHQIVPHLDPSKLEGASSQSNQTLLYRIVLFFSRVPDRYRAMGGAFLVLIVFAIYLYTAAFPKLYRELPFAENRSIGTLEIRNPSDKNAVWTPWREAKGTVYAPRRKQVRLILPKSSDVYTTIGDQLAILGDFEPDSFWEIDASDSGLGDDGLRHLAVLGGLRRLNLHNAGIDGSGFVPFLPETTIEYLDISGNDFDEEWMPWVAQFETLESLNLLDTGIDETGLKHLAERTGLRHLVLPAETNDDGIKHLRVMERLESLDLSSRHITDRGLSFIAKITSLQELDLSATPITVKGIEALVSLKILRSLRLKDTRIGDDALTYIATIPLLEDLDLENTLVTDIGLFALEPLKNLKRLNLANHFTLSRISDSGIPALTKLKKLKNLNLSGAQIGAESIETLVSIAPKHLSLKNTNLSAELVSELKSRLDGTEIDHSTRGGLLVTFETQDDLGQVWIRSPRNPDSPNWVPFAKAAGSTRLPNDQPVHLYLSFAGVEQLAVLAKSFTAERIEALTFPEGYTDIEEFDSSILGTLPNLKEIHIPEGNIPTALMQNINGLDSLTHLDLSNTTLSESAFAVLTDLPTLRSLDLSGASFPESAWPVIATFQDLINLDLSNTTAKLISGDALASLENLETLDLRASAISDEIVTQLRSDLSGTEILHYSLATRTIRFSESDGIGTLWTRQGGGEAPWTVAGDAKGSVQVPIDAQLRLDIVHDSNNLPRKLAQLPADALHTLHLTAPQVDDEALSEIMHLRSLEVLDLFGTKITNTGLAALIASPDGDGDTPFPDLRSLNLASTAITDEGIAEVSNLKSLRHLDLARTEITDASIDELLQLSALERLSIEGTQISREGYDTLAARIDSDSITFEKEIRSELSTKSPSTQVISIESDIPLGTLYTRDWTSTDEEDWTFLAPLFGDVPIQTGMAVQLVISPEDTLHINALASVSPNALNSIFFAPDTRVSRETLESLTSQRTLVTLILDNTTLESGALYALAKLPRLRTLGLNRARFDETELRYLRNLPWLENLNISNASINDESMTHLASIQSLKTLHAHSNANVADLGTRYLHENQSMDHLDLKGSGISNRAVAQLVGIVPIQTIDIHDTRVTAQQLNTLQQQQARTQFRFQKRNLDQYEIADLRPRIQHRIMRSSTIQQLNISDVLDVENISDISLESLRAVQEISIGTFRLRGAPISAELLAALSGTTQFRDAPSEIRQPLQKIALTAMASSDTRISYDALSEIAGVESFDQIRGDERLDLQAMALSSLAMTDSGIIIGDLTALENQTRLDQIEPDTVSQLQAITLQAMAQSKTGIETNDLAMVAGVDTFEAVSGDDRINIQNLALQAMANSSSGIHADDLAMLNSVEDYASIESSDLRSLQRRAMAMLVQTDLGVQYAEIAELGGTENYEDLSPESMTSLQKLALSAMVDTQILITSEGIAQVGGRDDFDTLPDARLEDLQVYALTSMSNSSSGITSESMVELTGLEDFAEFTIDVLEPIQVKALTAMADSLTGITLNGLATVTGETRIANVSDEKLAPVRSLAVMAMAKSSSGIRPSQLSLILGDSALRELDLSNSNVTDSDLLNITDMSQLRYVDLSGCKSITDTGVGYLAKAVNLEQIRLAGTSITNRALSSMWDMQSLRVLDLNDTSISDEALSSLVYLPALEAIYLDRTRIKGTGLSYMGKLTELRELTLAQVDIDDEGLASLPAGIPLNRLNLSSTNIGDASMPRIGTFTDLRDLDIAQCPNISDSGFQGIKSLTSLTRLSIFGTNVSDQHVDSITPLGSLKSLYVDLATFDSTALGILRRALPLCRIEGIASLIPKTGENLLEAPTAFQQIVNLGGQAIYTTMLASASFLMLIVPFAPIYIRHVLRFQEYALPGRIFGGMRQGAYVSGIVLNRGGRGILYTLRWFILLIALLIAVYLFVFLGTYIFDNYFALEADR